MACKCFQSHIRIFILLFGSHNQFSWLSQFVVVSIFFLIFVATKKQKLSFRIFRSHYKYIFIRMLIEFLPTGNLENRWMDGWMNGWEGQRWDWEQNDEKYCLISAFRFLSYSFLKTHQNNLQGMYWNTNVEHKKMMFHFLNGHKL
jgi:hypothetical protein